MNFYNFNRKSKSILLLLENLKLEDEIANFLAKHEYKTFQCDSVEGAISSMISRDFILAIMDWKIRGQSGIELAKIFKNTSGHQPVIFISQETSHMKIAQALDSNIDDYICEPLNPQELLSRVNAILRRHEMIRSQIKSQNNIVVDSLSIDVLSCTTTIDGSKIELTKSEFRILLALLKERGFILTRKKLVNKVKGDDLLATERTIDNHISELRKKLMKIGKKIKTVRGLGYKFLD